MATMNNFVMVHDLNDPDDPYGGSYKEVNADNVHTIPIGTLVEIKESGERLYVVSYGRDCDLTPLYDLGLCSDVWLVREGRGKDLCPILFSEDSLIVLNKQI